MNLSAPGILNDPAPDLLHGGDKLLENHTGGDIIINHFLQFITVGLWILLVLPIPVTASACIKVFNDGQAALGAEEIRNLPHDFQGADTDRVSEFFSAVHVHRVKDAVAMNMLLIRMHRHYKLMPVMSEFFHQRIAGLQRFSRLKRLTYMVGENVAVTTAAPGLLLI